MRQLISLTRLNKPVGWLLLFFPCLIGIILAFEGDIFNVVAVNILLLFLLGSIFARSAGCVINDLMDRDFDKKVKRTKDRPIASGEMSVFEAWFIFIVLLIVCLSLFLGLQPEAQVLCALPAIALLIYPLLKRFTYFAQLFLGIIFNWGIFVAWKASKIALGEASRIADSYEVIVLYLVGVIWTVIYDSIYAYVDKDDDKKLGLKSITMLFGKKILVWTELLFYITMLLMIILVILIGYSPYYIMGLLVLAYYFRTQHKMINLSDPKSMQRFFNHSWVYYLIIATTLFLHLY